jgi:rhodanese-related sulfurtransferase
MLKSLVLSLLIIGLLASVSFLTIAEVVDDTIFPLRDVYKNVSTITHQELANKINESLIIDVRSNYEFNVLHINSAINVPITNLGFIPTLNKIRASDERDIIFYCNGITCKKSYRACEKAKKNGIGNTFVFDLGILNWAKLYPEKSAFFNHSPLNLNKLIKPEKFRQHLLLPKDFIKKITPNSLLIDIREPFQREQLILQKNSVSSPLNKFHNTLNLIKKNKGTLLIYDAVGKQIRWLQYLLEKHDIKNYYFMQGGVKSYLAADIQDSEPK